MSASIRFWGSDGFGSKRLNPFKILENETRKIIVMQLYKWPMTVTQLADGLHLAQPTIFEHIQLLNEAGLVREIDVPSREKPHKGEKYYVPSFPIISDIDKQALQPVCEKIGGEFFQIFERYKNDLLETIRTTPVGQREFELRDLWGWFRMLILQSVYAEPPPRWPSGANFYFYGDMSTQSEIKGSKLEEEKYGLKEKLEERQSLSIPIPPWPSLTPKGHLWNEAFGNGYVHPMAPKGKINWGTGLRQTREGLILGFDWDKLQIVTNRGAMRLPSLKNEYEQNELTLMRVALRELKRMGGGGRSNMLIKKIRKALKKPVAQAHKH